MVERRGAPRFDFDSAVILTPAGANSSFVGTSVNLSETGMLIRASDEVPKGLRLEFTTASIAGECQVMWSSPTTDGGSLFGVLFTLLAPGAEEELTKLVSHSTVR